MKFLSVFFEIFLVYQILNFYSSLFFQLLLSKTISSRTNYIVFAPHKKLEIFLTPSIAIRNYSRLFFSPIRNLKIYRIFLVIFFSNIIIMSNFKLLFGKYKDQTLTEISKSDKGMEYLIWLNKQDKLFEKTKEALKNFLENL